MVVTKDNYNSQSTKNPQVPVLLHWISTSTIYIIIRQLSTPGNVVTDMLTMQPLTRFTARYVGMYVATLWDKTADCTDYVAVSI